MASRDYWLDNLVVRVPKNLPTKLRIALLALVLVTGPALPRVFAKDPPPESRQPPAYDVKREQRVSGVVEAILGQARSGMPAGEHLTLLTATGRLDVQLGPVNRRGARSLGLTVGDQVEVTGCVARFRGQTVFLARQVKRGDQVLIYRNERGFPVASRGRGR